MSDSHADVVVVGSSVGSARLVEALRKEDWGGSIQVITKEETPFYNRPPLSKEFLLEDREVDSILLLDRAKQESLDLTVTTGVEAVGLDVARRQVQTTNGLYTYGELVLATGAAARPLPALDGYTNVFQLRDVHDARRLRDALKAARSAVVIGFGFIGCEFSSVALTLGVDVTVIDSSLKPYSHFGRYFSDALTSMHRDEGAKLILGSTVTKVNGLERVESLELDSGEVIGGDLFVVAIGATPATDWLKDSALQIDDGVLCDARLHAGPHVHAIGDIARWPHPISGRLTRVEHWTNAVDQAATVAHNIAYPAAQRAHAATPYFWSTQFGRSIQYLGFLDNFSAEAWLRSERGGIAAILGKDDRVRGVIGIDAATVLMRARPLVAEGTSWSVGISRVSEIAERAGFEWF
ncbi:FAD-dependent oxidoreductase [Nocardioides sp. AE5]|uniref:NAD(P)/FAD-dependent oxidoreductase n=1 Tax=Nocardioides sp. AE5 TaxID=2962573 RepID=UPI00288245CE|nr:FAD-dependent oxidoreductase [Nocardioides sp. AE5]MDT0200467.1 FAD-dependent oxidoreductase [Nocardioides sp. AE5]